MSEIDDRLRAMSYEGLRELYVAAERWEEAGVAAGNSPLRKLATEVFEHVDTLRLNMVAMLVWRELARRSFEPVFKAYDSGVHDGEKTGILVGRRQGYCLAVKHYADVRFDGQLSMYGSDRDDSYEPMVDILDALDGVADSEWGREDS